MNHQELKNMAEGLAYTSKGLFKTADILKLEYKILLGISIFVSILTLAFDMHQVIVKVLGVLSLFASIWMMINENNQHKVSQYMELGNDFLTLYYEVEKSYFDNATPSDTIYQKRDELIKMTRDLPIFLLAKKWVDKVIVKEMNLQWIYG